MSGIQTHNVSGDRRWLNRLLEIQLPYDHDHVGPLSEFQLPQFALKILIRYVTLHNNKTILFLIKQTQQLKTWELEGI